MSKMLQAHRQLGVPHAKHQLRRWQKCAWESRLRAALARCFQSTSVAKIDCQNRFQYIDACKAPWPQKQVAKIDQSKAMLGKHLGCGPKPRTESRAVQGQMYDGEA
eukprot:347502-Chlamydomonas_euryale.AAC.4